MNGRKWPPQPHAAGKNQGPKPARAGAQGVLQPKGGGAQPPRTSPAPPPVYRPQAPPRVLQAKSAPHAKPAPAQAPRAAAPTPPQPARRTTPPAASPPKPPAASRQSERPTTPTAARPQPPQAIQRKTAAPTSQKTAAPAPPPRAAAPAPRPARGVLQRKELPREKVAPPRRPLVSALDTRVSVIQPYGNAKKSGLNGKLSQSGHYFVAGGALYVQRGAPAPHDCHATVDTIDRGNYIRYEGNRRFLKDCLHTAEEIMGRDSYDYTVGSVRSETADAPTADIGAGDPQNIVAALNVLATGGGAATNALAAPNPGQAYMIVETGPVQTYPYHAAAVVASDGADRVTLEMFAGAREAKESERQYDGKFAMYGGPGQSFHDEFAGSFNNPVTIVIKHK